jgi:diaminopimelate decarboxylase
MADAAEAVAARQAVEPFAYRNGEMLAESVPLARIAREVGTPAFVYSLAALRANYRAFMPSCTTP